MILKIINSNEQYMIKWEALLIYNIIWSIFSSHFLTDTRFLRQIPSFLRRYLSSVLFFFLSSPVFDTLGAAFFHSPSVAHVRCTINKGREMWGWQETKELFAGLRETIMTRDLLRQSQIRTWFPVRIPFSQGNCYKISVVHMGVRSQKHNFDPTVDPASHVQNGFLHFCCHEPTQIREYD